MNEKFNTIQKLFQSESFQSYAYLLLEKPITALEMAKTTGVSRQTIMYQLREIEPYVISRSSLRVKGRPLQLDGRILTDYFTIQFDLTQREAELLNDIIINQPISSYITYNNVNLGMVVMKIIMILLGIKATRETKDLITNMDKLSTNQKLKIEKERNNNIIAVIGKYCIAYKDVKSLVLDSLLSKVQNSKFPIIIFPFDLYELLLAEVITKELWVLRALTRQERFDKAKEFKEYIKNNK
ncbi:MAG: helix-turn-helix transcriptional regulator [Candidatus Micrarchaeota archaeon]|nr:helix-turn-helix transcriptional regulator [Candidatus Micrarchaeota archaeon]